MLIIRRTILLLLCCLVLFISTVFAKGVEVVVEPSVPNSASILATSAADKASKFFQETYGLELDHNVRIILVAGRDAYIQANIRENKVSLEEAERRAKTTRAWSQRNIIIQNAFHTSFNSDTERIFNIMHELVHQYQNQVSKGKFTRVMWLAEGAADIIAARILELDNRQSMNEFRLARLKVISKAQSRPKASELLTTQNWYTSLEKHGVSVTYRVADMAVLQLVELYGYPSLFKFFAGLKDSDDSLVFEQVYGMSLNDFEIMAEQKLSNDLRNLR